MKRLLLDYIKKHHVVYTLGLVIMVASVYITVGIITLQSSIEDRNLKDAMISIVIIIASLIGGIIIPFIKWMEYKKLVYYEENTRDT